VASSTVAWEPGNRREDAIPPPPEALPLVFQAATCLVDGLLHDARNPLNALAINLEVLSEKLKDEEGKIPESQEKNVRAMRDQIYRIDGVLRQFADFIAPRLGAPGEVNLAELVQRALDAAGHEARKRRVKLERALDATPPLTVRDAGAVHLLVAQLVLGAVGRAEAGAEIRVQLTRAQERISLEVSEPPGAGADEATHAALRALAQQGGADLTVRPEGILVGFAPLEA
jgi:signal transduction histidine kinase